MRRLLFAVLLWVTGFAYAGQDALTEMALESFRDAASHQEQPGLKQQAQLMMQVKNGLSLYRDGALPEPDKVVLSKLVTGQLKAAVAALAAHDSQNQRLAELMRSNAEAAMHLLALTPGTPAFTSKMDSYHSGIGYDAYRYAEDIGIEQL